MRIPTLIILLFASTLVYSQTFYRQYGNNIVHEGGLTIIESPDGNMFVGGYKDDSALVTKMDVLGNIIWTRAFKPVSGGPNLTYQLEITPDGYLFGMGNSLIGGVYRDVFFFKMDLSGTLLWMNRINDTRQIFGDAIEAKTTNEYLLVASVYELASATGPDVIFFRIDAANGTVITTSPRYDYITSNSYIDDPYASTPNTAGNRVYTTGRIYVNGNAPDGMRPYLSKWDLNGNHLSTSYLCWTAAQMARVYNTDIIYHNDSLTMCYFGDVNGSSSNFTVGLMRTDTAGNIAWSRNFNVTASGSEIASKVLVTPTGYMIVGYQLGGNNDFFVISTSANGNLIWAKSYGNAATAESFQVTTCPVAQIINGNLYMTGQSNTGGTRNLVVAAIDMFGNIGCMTPGTLSITQSNNPTTKTSLILGTVNSPLVFTAGGSVIPQPLSDVCSSTQLNLGNDTATCSPFVINATLPSATSYLWSTGATTSSITVSTAGTYWAQVTINCCIYTDTIIISNAALPVSGFTSNTALCSQTVSFTNTSINGITYSWNFGDATTSTQTNPSHTYVTAGSYTVTLIATSSCGADTAISTVVVNGPVTVIGSPVTATVCPGDNINLSATINGGTGPYTFAWNPGGSGQNITVNPVASSTYVVTGTDNFGCTSSATVTINVIPTATLSVVGAMSVCNGQSATLTANSSSGGPYTWSSSPSSSGSITVTPNTTTTYYVSIIDSCSGNTLTDSVTIVVLPDPTSSFSFTGPDCQNNFIFANSSNNSTAYNWNFGDLTTSTQTNPSHGYSAAGTYIITLIATNLCGSDTSQQTVIAGTPFYVMASPFAISSCPGSNVNLSASSTGNIGPVVYAWNPGGIGQNITVNPSVTTTFIVTGTDSIGCTSTDTAVVSIIPPTTLSISGSAPICSGQATTLTATSTSAGPFTWSSSASTASSIIVSPSTTTTYYVSVVDSCTGNILTDSVTITVLPDPVALFTVAGPDCQNNYSFTNGSTNSTSYQWDFGDQTTSTIATPSHQYSSGSYLATLISSNVCGSDTAILNILAPVPLDVTISPASAVVCIGDSIQVSAGTNGGVGNTTYSWTPSGDTTSSIVVVPTGSTTIVITATDSIGCSDVDSLVISVSSPVTLTTAGGNTICAGQSATISANASNGGPYAWSNNLGSNDSVTVTPSVTTTYYVSVYDSCLGTTIIDSVIIFVNPPTTVAFSLDTISGCAPVAINFTDLSFTLQDQIVSWLWDFGDGDSSTQQNPSHIYTTPGTYNIGLTVVTSSGCVTVLTNGGTVNVYPTPVAGFTWEQTGSIGDQPEVQFTDESTGATNWLWIFGDSTYGTSSSPFHSYSATGDFTAVQIVSNSYGCTDTASMSLHLTGEFTIYVPNAFTPGVGYFNNTFGGIGSGIAQYHMMIFDRWGMLIFESNDYSVQWDGRFKGNLVQVDTYVWVIDCIDFLGGEHHLIGHVSVIR